VNATILTGSFSASPYRYLVTSRVSAKGRAKSDERADLDHQGSFAQREPEPFSRPRADAVLWATYILPYSREYRSRRSNADERGNVKPACRSNLRATQRPRLAIIELWLRPSRSEA
jgi:hypothetical protein